MANNAKIAAETARDTWWYFKSHLHNPKWKQSDFIIRTADGKWIGNLKTEDKIIYKGCVISEKQGEFTDECINIDSTKITDWAFNDNGKVLGAFCLRISGAEKSDKKILEYTRAELVINRAVGDDFIALSRWRGVDFDSDSSIYYFFESRFKGGVEQLYKYLAKNFEYPAFAKKIGMQGYCYVKFGVNKDGTIADTEVLQSIGAGSKEGSFKLINEMPILCDDEHAQKVTFTFPIKYSLR